MRRIENWSSYMFLIKKIEGGAMQPCLVGPPISIFHCVMFLTYNQKHY